MNAPTVPQVPLLDLDLLRTLVAIVETGSFSGAAAEVHRTPSAISMQVKKVEEMLGRPLFVRDSRSVRPTLDGEVLVAHGRRMLALNRETVARFVQPDLAGVVRLGAPDDVAERFMPDMLRRFAESHPAVTVDVVVESTKRLLQMMEEGRLDLCLHNSACVEGAEGVEMLFRERLVWAALAGGCAYERAPLPVSVWDESCSWRNAATERLEVAGRDWRVAFQSAHIAGQRAAVLADLAVAPIPESCLDDRVVEAPARAGLPPLPHYGIRMMVRADARGPVLAAADHLRASFALRTGV